MRELVRRVPHYLSTSWRREGQGMVEYALIISFVAIVVIASLMIFGPAVASIFNKATASLT